MLVVPLKSRIAGNLANKLRLVMRFISKPRFGKHLRKQMKNQPKRGKSARHGNRPSPYTKYGKTPYQYTGKVTKPSKPVYDYNSTDRDFVKPSRITNEKRVKEYA